ncbi:3342_t:CDS:2 [Racocetra fulgida]|uniref:3342_t:CDS:1 n=1 Tax=Racocetra fulgida TaxID=60492 RepID=A0A9N8ZV76_9GLOM|nr:3342_t:CDS:2 [Racocetra fulgida]
MKKTQETSIESNSEAAILQPEINNIVDWNYLRTSDLKAICSKSSLQDEATKKRKEKLVDKNFGKENEKRKEPLLQKDFDNQNKAFFVFLLVKKPSTLISKRRVEFSQEQGTKALQIYNRLGEIVGGKTAVIEKAECSKKVDTSAVAQLLC